MKPLIIHTEGSGALGADCTFEDVREIAKAMAAHEHVVIHLHGGMVSEKAARNMAARLDPYYEDAGLLPVFFVWETHFAETVSNNLSRIAQEPIFKALIKKLVGYVVAKLFAASPGARSITGELTLPSSVEISRELEKVEKQEDEPYRGIKPDVAHPVTELSAEERSQFERDLKNDGTIEREVANILAGLSVQPPAGAKLPVGPVVPRQTLMDSQVKERLKAGAEEPGSRGLLETTVFVKMALAIFVRIVRRFKQKRDHGVYPTVVEEVLRELYIDSVGALLWGSMKNDARDSFVANDERSPGGMLLIKELVAALHAAKSSGAPLAKISLVGHSAGSIYACEMLRHAAAAHPDFKLHKLVFLAPAVSCEVFAPVLALHQRRPLWDSFRSYAMSDALESGYWEVPGIYSRSLLYLVSGVAEREGDESACDKPLVGMERYLAWRDIYKEPEIETVREYLLEPDKNRQVWAPSPVGASVDLASDSIRHGGFDDTNGERPMTMRAVTSFLKA